MQTLCSTSIFTNTEYFIWLGCFWAEVEGVRGLPEGEERNTQKPPQSEDMFWMQGKISMSPLPLMIWQAGLPFNKMEHTQNPIQRRCSEMWSILRSHDWKWRKTRRCGEALEALFCDPRDGQIPKTSKVDCPIYPAIRPEQWPPKKYPFLLILLLPSPDIRPQRTSENLEQTSFSAFLLV